MLGQDQRSVGNDQNPALTIGELSLLFLGGNDERSKGIGARAILYCAAFSTVKMGSLRCLRIVDD